MWGRIFSKFCCSSLFVVIISISLYFRPITYKQEVSTQICILRASSSQMILCYYKTLIKLFLIGNRDDFFYCIKYWNSGHKTKQVPTELTRRYKVACCKPNFSRQQVNCFGARDIVICENGFLFNNYGGKSTLF